MMNVFGSTRRSQQELGEFERQRRMNLSDELREDAGGGIT